MPSNSPTCGQNFLKNLSRRILPEISQPVIFIGAIGLSALALLLCIEQILNPPCCDAENYLAVANSYNANGIDSVREPLRTFAYPWILANIQNVASFLNLPLKFSIFLVQLLIYYYAVLSVSRHLCKTNQKLASCVYILLCFNIFIIPYIGLTLTDAIYTSLTIFVLLLLIKMSAAMTDDDTTSYSGLKLVFASVLLVSLAIVVRPAAIWLTAPLAFVVLAFIRKTDVKQAPGIIAAILAGAIPLYIQISINAIHFGEASFLPTTDLGRSQIVWGIENIKYGTWLGGGSPQNFYSSSAIVDLSDDHSTLAWYSTNPGDALHLITLKLVGAFDFDYLVPYPYTKPLFNWAPTLVSASIAWFGFCGVLYHLLTEKIHCLGSRLLPAVFLASWTAVTAPSAIELRFSLPIVCFFIITSAAFFYYSWKESKSLLVMSAGIWVVMLPVYLTSAAFIRNQSILAGLPQ